MASFHWHDMFFRGHNPHPQQAGWEPPTARHPEVPKSTPMKTCPRRIHRPNEKWACQNDVKQKGPDFFVKSFIIWNGCIQRLHDWKLSWHDDSTTRIVGGSMRSMLFIVGFTCTSTIFLGDDVTFLPSCKNGQHRQSKNWQLWRTLNRTEGAASACWFQTGRPGDCVFVFVTNDWLLNSAWTLCPQRIDQLHRI